MPPSPTGAVVFVAHGGGFTSTSTNRTNEATTLALCKGLAAIGIIAISIDYTPATGAGFANGQFPRAIQDFICAVRWGRWNVATYGGDPNRMGVAGISAGACLAMMTALTMQQGITVLGNGTSLVDATAPYQATAVDTQLVRRCGVYYCPTDFRVVANIGAGNGSNLFTYLQVSGASDPNFAPRASDASPIVLPHTGTTYPYWMGHGTADVVVYPAQSTNFSSAFTTLATGLGHNFDPTGSAAELAANLTIWAGGTGSLFGGL